MSHISKWISLGCMLLVMALAAASARGEMLLYYDFESDAGTTIANQGTLVTNGTLSGTDATAAGPAGGPPSGRSCARWE